MGAEGPKNIELVGEIADGWLPIYYSPKVKSMYRGWLDAGFARRTRPRTGFEIATNCQVVVTDDPDAAVDAMRPMLGFYIGGMGAKDMNFHKDVFGRMGYEKEVQEVQDLFFEGKRDEAIGGGTRHARDGHQPDRTSVQDPRRPGGVGGGGSDHAGDRRPLARRAPHDRRGDPRLSSRTHDQGATVPHPLDEYPIHQAAAVDAVPRDRATAASTTAATSTPTTAPARSS